MISLSPGAYHGRMKNERYLEEAARRVLADSAALTITSVTELVDLYTALHDRMAEIALERTEVIQVELDQDLLAWMARRSADNDVTINEIMEEVLVEAIGRAQAQGVPS